MEWPTYKHGTYSCCRKAIKKERVTLQSKTTSTEPPICDTKRTMNIADPSLEHATGVVYLLAVAKAIAYQCGHLVAIAPLAGVLGWLQKECFSVKSKRKMILT